MPGQGVTSADAADVLPSGMLTRMQVARRLGKSLATVRRLEGSVLHPRRDANGIHRFNPAEVEHVAEEAARSPALQLLQKSAPLEKKRHLVCQPTRSGRVDVTSRPDRYEGDEDTGASREDRTYDTGSLATISGRVQQLEALMATQADDRHFLREKQQGQHLQIACDVIELLDSLSDRQLKKLNPPVFDSLEALLAQLT